jgi:hypothetical protein
MAVWNLTTEDGTTGTAIRGRLMGKQFEPEYDLAQLTLSMDGRSS